jgi:nucleoside-diphosphate-sugar epimerase
MSNCVVTGGAGFIGASLLKQLLNKDMYQVVYVFDIIPPSLNHSSIRYVPCDIRKRITESVPECSTLFHLAALCKEPGYEWKEYFETNYIGTKNVCEFASRNGIKDIVFTSTMMVFDAGEKKNAEEDLTAPDTAYGLSKLLAEEVLLGWKNSDPQNRLKIVRPGVVFGKGEDGNYTRLYKALKKNLFVYVGRKDTIKGSIYVKEVVDFLLFLINDESERVTYNLVFPQPDSIQAISETICQVMGWRRYIPVVPYKLLLAISYLFESLNSVGLKNPIHHRRIEKLYYSTHLSVDAALKAGYAFTYNLRSALEDWKRDCGGEGLF